MKNFVVRYGLYAGCTLIVLGLINWFLIAPNGYTISEVFGYASMVAALITVPLGIRYFRDQLNQGIVSFTEGLRIGLGITFITSIIMGLYSALFFVFQGDEFQNWYKAHMSPEAWDQAQQQIASMPNFYLSPWFQGFVMLLTVFFIGTVITLLSALILKRNVRQA